MSFFSDSWVREVQTRAKKREKPTYDAQEVDDYIISLTAKIKSIRQELRKAIG